MKKDPLRLFFFVDGYTLKKVNEFYRYHHPYHSRLDFRALKNWARHEALRVFAPGTHYALMDCHYYHPYKNPRMHGGTWGMECFERELRFAGYQIHYCDQVTHEGVKPNMALLEDAMTFASYHRMDAAVLLTTQGQYAPFPDRLKMMGLPTLLLGWQFSYAKENRIVRWRTDPYLQELATHFVSMDRVAENSACGDAGSGLFCTE